MMPFTIPFVNFFLSFSYAAPNLFVSILTLSPTAIFLALLAPSPFSNLPAFLFNIFRAGDSGELFSESVRLHLIVWVLSALTMLPASISAFRGFLFLFKHPFLGASFASSSSTLFRARSIASAFPSSASSFFKFSFTLPISSINRSEFNASINSTGFSPWTFA